MTWPCGYVEDNQKLVATIGRKYVYQGGKW